MKMQVIKYEERNKWLIWVEGVSGLPLHWFCLKIVCLILINRKLIFIAKS